MAYLSLKKEAAPGVNGETWRHHGEALEGMHAPIPEQGPWLSAVVTGHIRYYGVPMNTPALPGFRFQAGRLWHRALCRRSQNARVRWDRMRRLLKRWLPAARVCHPYSLRCLGVIS